MCWWEQPTADALVPVGPRLLTHHRELMVELSSGRGASPLYREPWSRMDSILTLQTYNQSYIPLSTTDAERSRDLAFAAAATGANALVLELIDASPLLSTLDRGRRTLTSPTLERHEHGLTLVPGKPQLARRPALEEARLLEPGRAGPKQPRVGLVNGLALRPLEDSDSGDFQLTWTTALLAQNTFIDNFRLSAELSGVDPFDGLPTEPALTWSAVAQEQLIPRWFLQAEARSQPSSAAPLQLRAGLGYQLWPTDTRWMLRANLTYGFVGIDDKDALRRAELRLQWNGPWSAPIPVSSPLRGTQPGAPEPWPRPYFSEGNTVSWKAGVELPEESLPIDEPNRQPVGRPPRPNR